MNYPLISEYIEAIRSAEDNFDKLTNLRPVLDGNGNPIMSSGNFAVVFKMEDVETGKLYAVKCFLKEQEGRSKRYTQIVEELQFISSPYLLHINYMERELFVCADGCENEEFPVLIMNWVDGFPLDIYLKQHLHEKYELAVTAYRFCKMAIWLLSQPFTHGDLKSSNIIVRNDGTLTLIDYYNMYVPTMDGETANELVNPYPQNPLCTIEKHVNKHIDDLPIASIALSLKAISLNPELYDTYTVTDHLLFSAADYRDIGNSAVFKSIIQMASDAELSTLISAFLLTLSKKV